MKGKYSLKLKTLVESHQLGILTAWTGSGLGTLDILPKKAG